MPKFIRSDKLQDNVFVPVKLSDQILEGTLAHTIQYVIDQKIDMSMFEEKISNDTTGRPAHNPRIMLKLILFAYSNGINSSRRIHNFASQNLVAMALAENTVPDFTVIAAFISGMAAEVNTVFNNVLLVAGEMDLLGNTVFALDGCKLPSNASKEKSGTFDDLRKKQEKLKEKISYLVETHKQLDSQNQSEMSIGKKNAIDKMEKKIDRIEAFLSTHEARIGKRNKETQSNITDNESSKMKTSHGVIQGYNGQAMVDDKHQVIVASKAFGKGQDHTLLKPMLDSAIENYKQLGKSDDFLQGKQVIADTGYFSEENLDAADERSIDAYIPDQNFRKRDIRFVSKKRHVPGRMDKICRDDFVYDEKKDVVICPMGQELHLSKGAIRQVKNFIYKRYFGKRVVCAACTRRGDCLRSEKTKNRVYQIAVGDEDRDHVKAMIKKIDTPEGREIYSKRMSIVEPVFANIRIHKRLDRFTLRGQIKVNIQWMLYCIVHNISKISQFGKLNEAI